MSQFHPVFGVIQFRFNVPSKVFAIIVFIITLMEYKFDKSQYKAFDKYV